LTRAMLDETAIAELDRVASASLSGGLALFENAPFFCAGMPTAIFRALAARGLVNVVDARVVITAKGRSLLEGAA
jgi:hypothetical protein